MFLKNKQHIETHLSLKEVNFLLSSSKEFRGNINKENFKIREKSLFSNHLMFPVINGILKECDENISIFLSFEISVFDKIALAVFLIVGAFLPVYLYIMSKEILISLIVVLWILLLLLFFSFVYYKNCKRALKKLNKMFCSNL
ncbi:MAG: hypothetical protein IJ408_04235 [Clostridia bacterium]|nr:hypothetical protein [Clostridia bacterium]